MNLDTCYFMTSPKFYESRRECAISVYEMTTTNNELIELFDEENQIQWKVTKIKCVNWKEVEV